MLKKIPPAAWVLLGVVGTLVAVLLAVSDWLKGLTQ